MARGAWWLGLGWLGWAAGCGGEPRTEAIPASQIWEEGEQTSVEEPITYAKRGAGRGYGLPRAGQPGIEDLIALFPDETISFGDPSIFSSDELSYASETCSTWSSRALGELPMELEVAVTLYPRQYMKINVCGQDERHYGVYTVEDDTGGIIVLRNSRVAPFTYGDRIKLKVEAITLTFGQDLDTRAVLVSEVEPAEQPRTRDEDGEEVLDKTIYYEEVDEPFGPEHATRVLQVEGTVVVSPSNQNFGAMIVSSEPLEFVDVGELRGELLQCVRQCESGLRTSGRCASAEAIAQICPAACDGAGPTVDLETLPVCWQVGIDSELQRRGFRATPGQRIRARGPIVNNYDRQMWVLSTGQVEFLDE